MSEYDYLNARIRGMSSHLLGREFFDQALSVEGAGVVVDSLLNSTYSPALRAALKTQRGWRAAESALRRDLFETFATVRSLALAEPRRLLGVQFALWDLQNVLTVVRGKYAGAGREEILAALFPAGELDEARLGELAAEPSAPAVADALTAWGLPLAFELRRLIRGHVDAAELADLELECLGAFHAWAMGELAGADRNRSLLRSHFRRQVDLVNVRAALQRVRYRRDGWEGPRFAPLPYGRLDTGTVARIEACADLEEAFTVLSATYFGPAVARGILAFGERRMLGTMERFLEALVIEAGCRCFRADPLGAGVPFGYVWRKFNEFLNLRSLLRGKAYGRPAAAIREELLFV